MRNPLGPRAPWRGGQSPTRSTMGHRLVAVPVMGKDATGTAIGPILNPSTAGMTNIPAGTTDIQAIVTAASAGTKFYFDANTTYKPAAFVTPKASMEFWGQPGTRIAGDGLSAIFRASVGTGVTGVLIKNLTLSGSTASVVKCAENWVVDSCDISNAATEGITLAAGVTASKNILHHNHVYGVQGFAANGVSLLNNELAYNNWLRELGPNFGAGAFKILRTTGVLMDKNYSHNNYGPGMWCDTDNFSCTYSNNLVEDNAGLGIFHEISYGPTVISGNVVRRNGLDVVKGHSLFFGGEIFATSSDGVEMAGNTVVTFGNGMGGFDSATRGTSTATGQVYRLTNLTVHDNNITLLNPAQFVAGIVGGNWVGAGNSFTNNTYHVPNGTGAFWGWNNQNHTQAQWVSTDAQDATGTFLVP